MTTTNSDAKVSVTPEVFSFIDYDAREIAEVVKRVAERLGISNPIRLAVDESTPLAKMSASFVDDDGAPITDAPSSDSIIGVHVESGALEDRKRLTTFSADSAELSLGQVLLRARDRLRPDFAEVPPDEQLSLAQNAAWDAYCAGRMERAGFAPNEQRFRYNFRNRFGFTDDVDATFDRVWRSDDLAWSDLPHP